MGGGFGRVDALGGGGRVVARAGCDGYNTGVMAWGQRGSMRRREGMVRGQRLDSHAEPVGSKPSTTPECWITIAMPCPPGRPRQAGAFSIPFPLWPPSCHCVDFHVDAWMVLCWCWTHARLACIASAHDMHLRAKHKTANGIHSQHH